MVDFIFAVDDAERWHRENLERNPAHYAGIARILGASPVARLQRRFGAGLYYNTLVPMASPYEGRLMKYGVISEDDLVSDLVEWDTLYTSGRMHKPVAVLKSSDKVAEAARQNLHSALHAASLLLPHEFSSDELFMKIAGLSYSGDFRMTVGENPAKVRNIVSNNAAEFWRLYEPIWNASGVMEYDTNAARFRQDVSAEGRSLACSNLPIAIQHQAIALYNRTHSTDPVHQGIWYASGRHDPRSPALPMCIHAALAAVVARYAASQSIKGFATAGAAKSVRYVSEKLAKYSAAGGWSKLLGRAGIAI